MLIFKLKLDLLKADHSLLFSNGCELTVTSFSAFSVNKERPCQVLRSILG